jgi:hypothetical protein
MYAVLYLTYQTVFRDKVSLIINSFDYTSEESSVNKILSLNY